MEVGGTLTVIPQLSVLTINQDYGYKQSWINNYKPLASTYQTGSYTFDNWSRENSCQAITIANSTEDGMEITSSNSYPTLNTSIYQQFGYDAVESATDKFKIEFDWAYNNLDTSTESNVTMYVKVKADHGNHWLYNPNLATCAWNTSVDYIEITEDAPVGVMEWQTFSRYFTGLPMNGPYTISFYGLGVAAVDLRIRNVRFVALGQGITINQYLRQADNPISVREINEFFNDPSKIVIAKSYTVDNAVTGLTRSLNYTIGDVDDSGIDNVIEQFAGSLSIYNETLTKVAAKFVTDWAADYLTGGVVVTSSTNDIVFTANVAGVDFSGSTSIGNVIGSLDGSVVNTTANSAGTSQIDKVTLTGVSGTADITVNETTQEAVYNSTLTQTASDFVTNFQAFYPGITLSSSGADIFFEKDDAGNFSGSSTISNQTGDLSGSFTTTQAGSDPVARVDTITLSGRTGTADILCDGVTRLATFQNDYTEDWSTRGGSESDPIIELIGGEIGNQFSRPKHLLDLELYERNDAFLDIVGNLQDDLNQYSGADRKFVMSGGTYDVRIFR